MSWDVWRSAGCGQLADSPEAVRLGVLVGVLGGFTTFSSFGLEAVRLMTAGQWGLAAAYVLISNAGGLAGAWLGTRL